VYEGNFLTTDYADEQMLQEELSGKIIGVAMEVLNGLRPGLDEKLYERALTLELKRRGHVVSVQRSFPVWYRGELIGNLVPDLILIILSSSIQRWSFASPKRRSLK
jgi:PD-(D/E)XK nuclease superfamily protein